MHRTMILSSRTFKLAAFVLAGALLCCGQSRAASPVAPEPAQPTQLTSEQTPPPTSGRTVHPSSAGFSERNPRYEVRSGDSMDVAFHFSPEFNQSVTVQPDGFVTLREIGDVKVAGQTVPQLSETIKTAYGKILNDPAVSVILRDFEKPYFIASGQVAKPGKYELRGDVTLTEAVAIAGGFNENSKHSNVVLYRKVSNGWKQGEVVDVKKMMASRNLGEDIQLNSGDMIFVPQNTYSKIKRFIPTPGMGVPLP